MCGCGEEKKGGGLPSLLLSIPASMIACDNAIFSRADASME